MYKSQNWQQMKEKYTPKQKEIYSEFCGGQKLHKEKLTTNLIQPDRKQTYTWRWYKKKISDMPGFSAVTGEEVLLSYFCICYLLF